MLIAELTSPQQRVLRAVCHNGFYRPRPREASAMRCLLSFNLVRRETDGLFRPTAGGTRLVNTGDSAMKD